MAARCAGIRTRRLIAAQNCPRLLDRRAQVRVDARWSSLPQGGHPTLLPLLLRRGGHAEALLVAGVEAATLLSPMGSRLTEFPIPSPPVASFEAVDFDGAAADCRFV